jgi:hypothetical protein
MVLSYNIRTFTFHTGSGPKLSIWQLLVQSALDFEARKLWINIQSQAKEKVQGSFHVWEPMRGWHYRMNISWRSLSQACGRLKFGEDAGARGGSGVQGRLKRVLRARKAKEEAQGSEVLCKLFEVSQGSKALAFSLVSEVWEPCGGVGGFSIFAFF